MELWKDISGYEGMYQVSNYGNIRTLKGKIPKVMKPHIDNKGYYRQSFYKDGKSATFKYHRLVATTFIKNPDNKPQVNHKDGNKTNNHDWNLEWMTNDENMNHSKENKLRIGKMPTSENHQNSKLTNEQVRYIRSVYKKSSREFGGGALSKQFGVTISCINRIILNVTYKDVT